MTTHRRGLTEIYPAGQQIPGGRIENDIVFVHGLRGNSHDTWTTPDNGTNPKVFWPERFLPDDLVCTPSRILTYGYDADIGKLFSNAGGGTMRDHASNLTQSLVTVRSNCPGRPLIFVGHSLGGLVVKTMLLKASRSCIGRENRVAEDTKSILFLATPHRGSEDADLGKIIAKLSQVIAFGAINTKLIEQLRPSSDILDQVLEDFPHWVKQRERNERAIHIANFYETRYLFIRKWLIWRKKFVVSKMSATSEGTTNISVDADHIGIAKFAPQDEPSYRMFLSELRTTLQIDPTKVEAAIRNDDTDALRNVINSGYFDFNQTIIVNGIGNAICFAAHIGSNRTFEQLSKDPNINIDIEDPEWKQRPLFRAVKGGHIEIVRQLLATGRVEINAQDKDGQTALIAAADKGVAQGVQILLDSKADCTIRSCRVKPDFPYSRALERKGEAMKAGDADLVERYDQILDILKPHTPAPMRIQLVKGDSGRENNHTLALPY